MDKKFDAECEITSNFLNALGVRHEGLLNPKEVSRIETGADVQVRLNPGKDIGIQVTVYHADENDIEKGSRVREQEEKNKREGELRPLSIPANFIPALEKRLKEKVAVSQEYRFEEFSEVWLLVAASLMKPGALASTMLPSALIKPEELTDSFHELLSESKYSSVYLYLHNEKAVYQWNRQEQWKTAKGADFEYENGLQRYF